MFAWRFARKSFWIIVLIAFMSLMIMNGVSVINLMLILSCQQAWGYFLVQFQHLLLRNRSTNNLLTLFGLGAILFSIFAYDKTIPFPSLYSLFQL